MGFRLRTKDDQAATAVATARWAEVAQQVTHGYARLEHLPLDEAAETAWLMTPGGMSREEIARRLAARRHGDLA